MNSCLAYRSTVTIFYNVVLFARFSRVFMRKRIKSLHRNRNFHLTPPIRWCFIDANLHSVNLDRQLLSWLCSVCVPLRYADDIVAIYYVLQCDVSGLCAILLLLRRIAVLRA